MMNRMALPVFFLAGCSGLAQHARPWEYKATDRAGFTRITEQGIAPLIRRAEQDFRASPAFPEHGPRSLEPIAVARHRDGRTLIAFSIGGISDMNAVYLFDIRGEITDRYLHSYWGVPADRMSQVGRRRD